MRGYPFSTKEANSRPDGRAPVKEVDNLCKVSRSSLSFLYMWWTLCIYRRYWLGKNRLPSMRRQQPNLSSCLSATPFLPDPQPGAASVSLGGGRGALHWVFSPVVVRRES